MYTRILWKGGCLQTYLYICNGWRFAKLHFVSTPQYWVQMHCNSSGCFNNIVSQTHIRSDFDVQSLSLATPLSYCPTKPTGNLWWYCWWTKSCTTKDDNYPIIYSVLTIPGGAGFLPKTVLLFLLFSFQRRYKRSCISPKRVRFWQASLIGDFDPQDPAWWGCGWISSSESRFTWVDRVPWCC